MSSGSGTRDYQLIDIELVVQPVPGITGTVEHILQALPDFVTGFEVSDFAGDVFVVAIGEVTVDEASIFEFSGLLPRTRR